MGLKVMIFAGEASGEMYGGLLAEALKDIRPDACLAGIGGDSMAGAGVELVAHIRDLSVMGFWEVVRDHRKLRTILRRARESVRRERPDAVVLIDFYRFNIEIAREAKGLGIPVFYYVAPKLWAWGGRRIRVMKKLVDRIMAVFPFEEGYFRDLDMPVTYVGNPLMELLERDGPAAEAADAVEPGRGSPVIALLPGSRQSEVRQLLPVFLSSARLISGKLGGKARFILPLAGTVPKSLVEGMTTPADIPLIVTEGDARGVLRMSDAAIVASGTATLEAFLTGTPQVVAYRTAWLTSFLFRRMVRIPWVSLPNILSGREVVREVLQEDLTPENLAESLMKALTDEEWKKEYRRAGREVRESLRGREASRLAAKAVLAPFEGSKEGGASP